VLKGFGEILFNEEGVNVAVENLAAFVRGDGMRNTAAWGSWMRSCCRE